MLNLVAMLPPQLKLLGRYAPCLGSFSQITRGADWRTIRACSAASGGHRDQVVKLLVELPTVAAGVIPGAQDGFPLVSRQAGF